MIISIQAANGSGQRRAMTLIEVMISLAVLAVITSTVASNWFTLRQVQIMTQDENKVHELARSLAERISGANWDWIGRDRPDEIQSMTVVDNSVTPPTNKIVDVVDRSWRRFAWSWHRRETPRKSGDTIRLPPLTDHDWTDADYVGFRTHGSLTSTQDVSNFDPDLPVAKQVNPHNLVDLGIIDKPTGLMNLMVYMEYYHSTALDTLFTQSNAAGSMSYWASLIKGGDEANIFQESPFLSDSPSTQMNPSDPSLTQQAMVVRIIITWRDRGDLSDPWIVPNYHRHELVLARRK